MKTNCLAPAITGIATLFLTGLLAGCATISTGSHYDETTNFGAYRSFSWIDADPYITAPSSIRVSPLTEAKIQAAIRGQLEEKGYEFVDDRSAADFVVGYTVGTRDQIRVDDYPQPYRGYWGWHTPYSYYYVRETSVHTYTKGTLGVDIFDNESGKPVWHGWAEKTVTDSDRADPTPAIKEGVSMLFQDFPR